MNQIEGTIVDHEGHAWFEAGELRLDLGSTVGHRRPPLPAVLGAAAGGDVATEAGRASESGPAGHVSLTEVIAPDQYARSGSADRTLAGTHARRVAAAGRIGASA